MSWMWRVVRRFLGKLFETPPGSKAPQGPNADRMMTLAVRTREMDFVTSIAMVTPPGVSKLARILAEHTFE